MIIPCNPLQTWKDFFSVSIILILPRYHLDRRRWVRRRWTRYYWHNMILEIDNLSYRRQNLHGQCHLNLVTKKILLWPTCSVTIVVVHLKCHNNCDQSEVSQQLWTTWSITTAVIHLKYHNYCDPPEVSQQLWSTWSAVSYTHLTLPTNREV